jgi:hypothetical protein
MNDKLIIEARNILNKSRGFSIAVNSVQHDSDALVFINDTEVYIHFKVREYVDINILLTKIINIEIECNYDMKIIHLYTNDGRVVSVYCLPK